MSTVFDQPSFNPARVALPELQATVWAELHRACGDVHHPWRLPCLATVHHSSPCQRTVVLRRVEHSSCQLFAHSDVRTAKINQLKALPGSSWLFYDPDRRIQLVMAGNVQLHFSNVIADQEWSLLGAQGRNPYRAPHAPGEPSGSPSVNLPESVGAEEAPREENSAGRENFAVIAAHVITIDLLFLRPSGHLRAKFDLTPAGWHRTWVQP